MDTAIAHSQSTAIAAAEAASSAKADALAAFPSLTLIAKVPPSCPPFPTRSDLSKFAKARFLLAFSPL
jgi:hypothetical protein